MKITDLLNTAKEQLLLEKAVSKKQQRFMGMVHSAQKGAKPASPEVASVAKSISKKAAKDYASTKHKNLDEAPLPDGGPDFNPNQQPFDKDVYNPRVSFAKRIAHAVERAKKMGTGSSRVAFDIEYMGRPTVLKIAKNVKGAAQNEAEANLLDDYYVHQLGIAIPLIDYDTDNDQPTWIHTEKATKASEKQLCQLLKCGSRLRNLIDVAAYNAGKSRYSVDHIYNELQTKFKYTDDDIQEFEEFASTLADLANSFDINLFDFTRAANWGIYNGNPVVIDLGFTEDVKKAHYSR